MVEKSKVHETKAHEMAEKQREISVSEFFAKNRHLLGFDNPRKALLTAVKEACDNSLTYDMPLIVRLKGKTSIVNIGQLVDNFIETNKTKTVSIRDNNLEKLPIQENLEVLAFDKKDLKLSFRKVSTVFRHKVNSKIYRVKLISGRYVDLTAYHSVFTLIEGKVVSIPTSELKEGMSIVVPKREWDSNFVIKEINLIEELLLLDISLTEKINVYGINSFFTDNIVKQIRTLLPKSKWYKTNDFRRFNYIPLNILRHLKLDLGKFNDSKIGMSFSKYKIPAVLKIDYNFAELLGLYVSEGSMLKSQRRIHFSFGSHEKELIYYLADLFEKVFKFSPKITKAHDTAYNVLANSTILCFVFKHILKVGNDAKTKVIPNFVFDFNNSLKYSFLLAYLTGDGYPTKELFYLLKNDLMLNHLSAEKITCATASYELFVGLQYLLSSLGLNYSMGYKEASDRVINNVLAKFGKSYLLYIYSSNKNSAINFLPINNTIIGSIDSKLSYSISRRNQNNVHVDTLNNNLYSTKTILYEGIQKFLAGDLGVLAIKSIEEINYDHEWVYDISVPECENFVAGVGAILCHNSLDACEEARILPDIYVELQQIREDRFKVIVEDNGPGILKEQAPKIFGKLLYGSKFHRLRVSRGQQGIGISAVLLYGQLTTGKGMQVTSRISSKHPAHYFEIHIDTQKNQPIIAEDKIVEWKKEHGTRIEVELQGTYQKGKQSVDEYLKEVALINPHAQITYKTPEKETINYPRAVNELPKEAKEIKPHPYGVELGVLIRMLQSTESGTLSSFLQNDFSRISQQLASEICNEAKLNPRARPTTIAREEAEKLFNIIQKTKIVAPPTDCLNPLGEDALIKGLKKEINAEFYTAVTRSPEVYRGNPFLIECCTPDTKLILENGAIVNIKDYVENNLSNLKVLSMNSNFEIQPTRVIKTHKIKSHHKIFKIKTSTGRELNITSDNEIPLLSSDGNLIWKKVTETNIKERIAVPSSISVYGKDLDILSLFDENSIKVHDTKLVSSIVNELRLKFTLKDIAKKLNLDYNYFKACVIKKGITRLTLNEVRQLIEISEKDWDIIKKGITKFSLEENKIMNPKPIKIKGNKNAIFYLIGLIVSDGYLPKKNDYTLIFVNNDENLHQIFKLAVKTVFGLEVTRVKYNSIISSKTLCSLIKRIVKTLPGYNDELILSFLKGYADGDGTIREDGTQLGFCPANKDEAFLLQYLLLRFGIISNLKITPPGAVGNYLGRDIITKKEKYLLYIYNNEDKQRFKTLIGFRQNRKESVISKTNYEDNRLGGNTKFKLPLGNLLKIARLDSNLTQTQLGISDTSIRAIEKGRSDVTNLVLKKILNCLNPDSVYTQQIQKLVFNDILWDEIIEIKEQLDIEYVYDLTTESGNFIADLIVMHNCALAYGGDLSKEDHIKIMRFANRVPLLYQQGACATSEGITDTAWKNYGLNQSKDSLPIGPVAVVVHMVSVWVPFTSEAKEAIAHYPEIIKEMKLALQEAGRRMAIYIRKNVKAREQQERINLFEKYIPELANSLSLLSGEKKIEIEEYLRKGLQKGMKDLLEGVKQAESEEMKGNVVFGEKQQTLEEAESGK